MSVFNGILFWYYFVLLCLCSVLVYLVPVSLCFHCVLLVSIADISLLPWKLITYTCPSFSPLSCSVDKPPVPYRYGSLVLHRNWRYGKTSFCPNHGSLIESRSETTPMALQPAKLGEATYLYKRANLAIGFRIFLLQHENLLLADSEDNTAVSLLAVEQASAADRRHLTACSWLSPAAIWQKLRKKERTLSI